MRKQKKIAIWTVSVFVAYLLAFGPMEMIAGRLSQSKSLYRISYYYFMASGILNYPHYQLAAMSSLYYRYYAKCYDLGTGGKLFFKDQNDYRKSFFIFRSPSMICFISDQIMIIDNLANNPDTKFTILPDPDWGSLEDFTKFGDKLAIGMTKEKVISEISRRPFKNIPADNAIICEWQCKYEMSAGTTLGDGASLIIYFDSNDRIKNKSFINTMPQARKL